MPSDAEYYEAIKGRYSFELPSEYQRVRGAEGSDSIPWSRDELNHFVGDTMWLSLKEILEYHLFDPMPEVVPFAADESSDHWCWSPKHDDRLGTPVLRCYHDNDSEFYAPNLVGWFYRRLLDYAWEIGEYYEEKVADARDYLHFWQERLHPVFPDGWYQTIDTVRQRPEFLPMEELDGIVSRDLAFPLLGTKIALSETPRAPQVTDAKLGHLHWMIGLKELYLWETQVTDAGLLHVSSLTNLEYLNLHKTQVTDAGIQHLKSLANLKELCVTGTQVTDDGAKKLQQALPNCKIEH
ncbi:leucine-rich repeat domain-containing protein [Planctomycetota bacterium]